MSRGTIEIEAKLWVEDLARVEAALVAAGGSERYGRVFERNVRYEDAQHSLTPNGIVLRLRQDSRVRLTYKGPMFSSIGGESPQGVQSRFEAEVTVDDFATMDLILNKLGFAPFMVYEKYRTTYTLGEVEIVLDEMPYGNFVEVEGPPDQIESVIKTLNLARCRRFQDSYARLFDYVRANLDLTFTDLTFENFAGISVPLEAFQPPGEEIIND